MNMILDDTEPMFAFGISKISVIDVIKLSIGLHRGLRSMAKSHTSDHDGIQCLRHGLFPAGN
jgi:hypothetical protein